MNMLYVIEPDFTLVAVIAESVSYTHLLKSYLVSQKIENIFRDMLPDEPDNAVGLFLWSHSVPAINYGAGARYVQVQVRDMDWDAAYLLYWKIAGLLDLSLIHI